jgi:hypothetical protein
MVQVEVGPAREVETGCLCAEQLAAVAGYRLVGQALRENAECTLRPTLSTLADLAETFQALTMSMFALSRSYLPC